MQSPLALANIALPWLIFVQRREWLRRLDENFDVTTLSDAPFSAFPTWLLVESPTRSQSHICLSRAIQQMSPSVAAFLASAPLFYCRFNTALMPTGEERSGSLTC
jgi:hypothetical protein